jgi:probable O-glycosylation ligase (exosortase A-associated)
MLLQKKHHIVAFAWVTTASLGILAAKGGIFTILTGGSYRVWGPPNSFIADNNDFALATVVAIPMLHFLQLRLSKGWMRHAMTGVILLCAASALGSQSRGGMLALAATGVVFWLRSAHKLTTGVMILIVALALVPMMPEQWWDRMGTIATYSEDTSAMGRINAWHVAWHTALNYPFGGGMSYQHAFLFEQYGPYEGTVRAAHSIYFQILGNHGFVGLFLFLMMWISAYRCASWLRVNTRDTPEAAWARDLGSMIQVSLIGFAIGGAFLSLPYFDLPYNLMIMAVLARKWVERRSWETEQPVTLLESIGLAGSRSQQGLAQRTGAGSAAGRVAAGHIDTDESSR